jgi:hypothetical protein
MNVKPGWRSHFSEDFEVGDRRGHGPSAPRAAS